MSDFLPPRPGDEQASIAEIIDGDVPVRLTIQGRSFDLSPADALNLAGEITATVSAWMAAHGS